MINEGQLTLIMGAGTLSHMHTCSIIINTIKNYGLRFGVINHRMKGIIFDGWGSVMSD